MKRIIDLFCGTGGFSKGFENARNGSYSTVLGIDLLPIAIDTFRLNHPHAVGICGDIRELRRSDIIESMECGREDIDLIIGGPPCQGFSSIRPFRSSNDDDPRNTLFEEFASFVNFFRPNMFVLENVVGLATHKSGSTIGSMASCFDELGYDSDWKILNAAHFGIPQKRERLIMIGAMKGAKIEFPTPTHQYVGPTIGHSRKSRMLLPTTPDLFNQSIEVQPSLTVWDAISDLPPLRSGECANKYTKPPLNDYQIERREQGVELALHESTNHSPKMLEIIRHSGKNINSIPQHLISSGFSSCYSRLDADAPSVTITVNFVHPASNRCIHPTQDRALTPREGARLQSYDDTFVFAGSRSQIVKQIGNAVPPLLGQKIGETLAKLL